MTQRSQRHRSTTLPFRYRKRGIDFDIDHYAINGSKPRDIELKAGQSEIDLVPAIEDKYGTETDLADWTEIKLYGQLSVTEATIAEIFPPEERGSPPAKLYVALRCHETISRTRAEVDEPFDGPGTYEITINLERSELLGAVELHPFLVRSEDGDSEGDYAATKNVRVAGGHSYRVIIDREQHEEPTHIDGEEVSFSDVAHLPEGEKLYYLDFRNEKRPKLWINADHPRITNILQSKGSVGAEPRMRDVILDQIGHGVWTQLVIRAGAAVDDNGEVPHEWQRMVIDTFAPNLYAVDDPTEAALQLRADVENTENLPHFMERVDREVQEFLKPREQLINLMEEGLRI